MKVVAIRPGYFLKSNTHKVSLDIQIDTMQCSKHER